MADVLTYVAAALALAAAVGRYLSIRPASPACAQRHLLVALAAIAPSLALVAPATQAATARIDPFPYATESLSSALAMLAAYCVVAMLAHVVSDSEPAARPACGHLITLVLAVAIMTVLLLADNVEFGGDLTTAAAHHRLLAAHQVVYFGYLGSCTTRFIRLMRRYLARPDARPLMRQGMYLIVLAAVAGQLWLAWNILTLVMAHAGRHWVGNPAAISQLLGATAATLMALGSTLPAWGGWAQRTLHRGRVQRAVRDITPLWRLLATVLPEITLRQPNLTHPELLLYRRVIEIRDAQRKLLGYAHPDIDRQVLLASAREHRLDKITIRMEAAALVTAIDAYRAGHRRPAEAARVRHPYTIRAAPLAEAHWLIQVHAAMRHDRTVARIAQHARDQRVVDDGFQEAGPTTPRY